MALGPIQTRPTSLGALLTLKTRGDMPKALLDEVRGMIDLESWWLRTKTIVWPTVPSRALGAGGGGFYQWLTGSPVVPSNEWWYVRSASVSLVQGAATPRTFIGQLAYFVPPVVPFRVNAVAQSVGSGGVATGDAVMFAAFDFWMPPGAQLGIWVNTMNASSTLDLNGFEYVPLSLFDG